MDKSLLTDEEREKREMALKLVRDLGPMKIGIDAMDDLRVMAFIADDAFTALIAARAENEKYREITLRLKKAKYNGTLRSTDGVGISNCVEDYLALLEEGGEQ